MPLLPAGGGLSVHVQRNKPNGYRGREDQNDAVPIKPRFPRFAEREDRKEGLQSRLSHRASSDLVETRVPRTSSMNKAPDDRAQRAQPENAGGHRLNAKTSPAFFGGLRIPGHIESPWTTAVASIAGHLQISYPAVAALKADRPFPIGKTRSHPAVRIQRGAFYPEAVRRDNHAPCCRHVAAFDLG